MDHSFLPFPLYCFKTSLLENHLINRFFFLCSWDPIKRGGGISMQGLFKFQHSQPPHPPTGCWALHPYWLHERKSATRSSCIMSCVYTGSAELELWLLFFLSGTAGQLGGAQHSDRIHHQQAVPSYRIWNQPQQRAGQGGEWADLHSCAHRWACLPMAGQVGTLAEDLRPTKEGKSEVVPANAEDTEPGIPGSSPGCSSDSLLCKTICNVLPFDLLCNTSSLERHLLRVLLV